jgi:hypothetical protein
MHEQCTLHRNSGRPVSNGYPELYMKQFNNEKEDLIARFVFLYCKMSGWTG